MFAYLEQSRELVQESRSRGEVLQEGLLSLPLLLQDRVRVRGVRQQRQHRQQH